MLISEGCVKSRRHHRGNPKVEANFPCICSHSKEEHDLFYTKSICNRCSYLFYNVHIIGQDEENCMCRRFVHEFKGDNLKYLLDKYEQSR